MRICVASDFGEGMWLAWLMSHEGHDVSAVVHNEQFAGVLSGLGIPIMPGGEVYVAEKYDLIVWDATGNGKDADRKSTRLNSSHSGESRMPSSA